MSLGATQRRRTCQRALAYALTHLSSCGKRLELFWARLPTCVLLMSTCSWNALGWAEIEWTKRGFRGRDVTRSSVFCYVFLIPSYFLKISKYSLLNPRNFESLGNFDLLRTICWNSAKRSINIGEWTRITRNKQTSENKTAKHAKMFDKI